MSERKPWSEQEDESLRALIVKNESQQSEHLKWGEIAEELNQTGTRRTGKQCRERWHNQLRPGIENERAWTQQQEMVLFRVQEEVGNRWAQIARQLPGRTDNNIKNFFNSALRKALRKVNLYVGLHKKEEGYRNVKEFKQATLSKIIAVAERKYENKINLRGTGVEHDARVVKRLLVEIQRDEGLEATEQREPLLEEAVERLLEFNRNCKRRKGKRHDSMSEAEEEKSLQSEQIEQPKQIQPKQGKEKQQKRQIKERKARNSREKQKPAPIEQLPRKQSSLVASRNMVMSGLGIVGRSSSSNQKESSNMVLSSSFREFQPIADHTVNYNPFFESIRSNEDRGGFISSLPNLQKSQTNRSEPLQFFWREDAGPEMLNLMQRSGNMGNFGDLNMSLGISGLLQRRSSRLDRSQPEGFRR